MEGEGDSDGRREREKSLNIYFRAKESVARAEGNDFIARTLISSADKIRTAKPKKQT